MTTLGMTAMTKPITTTTRRLFAVAALSLAVSPAFAVEYTLTAKPVSVTMPDGASVSMWGYALPGQEATVPGPVLTVPPGDTMLTIHLENALPQLINGGEVPTSIVVPGQATIMTPVKFTDGAGRSRVRSFTHETVATTTVDYTWTNLKPGTFLYHSGTQPQVQVQMGLYGSVVVQSAAGQAYPGVAYDNDVTLVYSEVDPVLHAAVADGSYGTAPAMTSTLNYVPKYFLVNGQSHTSASSPISLGTPGSTVLLRMVNAGLETHAPMLQGAHMTLVAEDGSLYPYRAQQYLATLPAGKTMDATITVPANGQAYPLYDRRLRLSNAVNGTSSANGMVNILRSGHVPVAADDAYSTDEDVVLNVAANGVLGNDADTDLDTLTAVLVGNVAHGNLVLNADGSFSYTPNANFSGTDSFTYKASDGGFSSNIATVTITVNVVNDAPVAGDDTATTIEDTAAIINVLANDTDIDAGTTLTIASVQSPTTKGGTVVANVDGTLTYTPALNWNSSFAVGKGPDTFTYSVNDGVATSAPATVSVTVTNANDASVGVNDNYDINVVGNFSVVAPGVLANDTDAENQALTAVLVSNVYAPKGSVVLNSNGSFTFTPTSGFFGTATFTYRPKDPFRNGSIATVTLYKEILVTRADFRQTAGLAPAWIIRGQSAAPGSTITVYKGATVAGGTLLGNATVGATGVWEFRQLNPAVTYAPGDAISLEASTGQKMQNVTVNLMK